MTVIYKYSRLKSASHVYAVAEVCLFGARPNEKGLQMLSSPLALLNYEHHMGI